MAQHFMNNLLLLENVILKNRGFVSKWPSSKKAVFIVSGGLDSIVTSARLIEEQSIEIFPLHIHRGQTNYIAENKAVDFFTKYFQKRYGQKMFHNPMKISVNIPPKEFKGDLLPYTKEKGHPVRDQLMHLLGVEYAVAASIKHSESIKTVYCAIMPEDYFPHSTLEGLRANTINTCQNMKDWEWQITSPNIDPILFDKPISKIEEIKWAMQRNIPIERTISCNNASKSTKFLPCGDCSSCERRKQAFEKAGYPDPTKYFKNV